MIYSNIAPQSNTEDNETTTIVDSGGWREVVGKIGNEQWVWSE